MALLPPCPGRRAVSVLSRSSGSVGVRLSVFLARRRAQCTAVAASVALKRLSRAGTGCGWAGLPLGLKSRPYCTHPYHGDETRRRFENPTHLRINTQVSRLRSDRSEKRAFGIAKGLSRCSLAKATTHGTSSECRITVSFRKSGIPYPRVKNYFLRRGTRIFRKATTAKIVQIKTISRKRRIYWSVLYDFGRNSCEKATQARCAIRLRG